MRRENSNILVLVIITNWLCLSKTDTGKKLSASEPTLMDSIDQYMLRVSTSSNSTNIIHRYVNHTGMIWTELDLLLPPTQFQQLRTQARNNATRIGRKATSEALSRWPGGYVFYELARSAWQFGDLVSAAVAHWENYTCLDFIEENQTSYRITIKAGPLCGSYVGLQWTGQDLVLNPECATLQTVIHELGHAIGFFHEHMRPDRDNYVSIQLSRVPKKHREYYKKYGADVINTYGIPYDYTSIMHYGGFGFMTTLDPRYQKIIGISRGLSFRDIKLANLMYDCLRKGQCPERSCPFQGFMLHKSFKDRRKCECWCDSGNTTDPLVTCSSIDQEAYGPKVGLQTEGLLTPGTK